MNKCLATLLAFLLALWPVPAAWAQSGGNCSIFRSWLTGNSLTASDLTSSFTTVGVTNVTQACVDGISDTVAGMQTTTDPFPSQSESLATSGAGELQRLRFMIQRLFGLQDWYRHDANVNFAHAGGGVNVQGSGVGRHVTAVGLHVWSGFRQGAPRPGQFPAFTSVDDHWTGLAFPAPGHVSLVIGNPLNGLVQGGVESVRWHAQGMTFHHTAAIRFAHSTAQMDGGQRGHVTALQIHQGLPGAGGPSDDNSKNDAAYKDSIVLGHVTVGLMIHGTGITGGANRLYGLSNDGRYVETKTLSGTSSVTITHQAGQLVFSASGGLPVFVLKPEAATLSAHEAAGFGRPDLVKHTGTAFASYGLMYHSYNLSNVGGGATSSNSQSAHWYVALPSGISVSGLTIEIFSRQGTATTGVVGWHVLSRVVADGAAWDASRTQNTVYPATVKGTAGQLLVQAEDLTTAGLAAGTVLQIAIVRIMPLAALTNAAERTTFTMAVIRVR